MLTSHTLSMLTRMNPRRGGDVSAAESLGALRRLSVNSGSPDGANRHGGWSVEYRSVPRSVISHYCQAACKVRICVGWFQ